MESNTGQIALHHAYAIRQFECSTMEIAENNIATHNTRNVRHKQTAGTTLSEQYRPFAETSNPRRTRRRFQPPCTSKSPVISATFLTLVSVIATRISFSSRSSRLVTPACP